MKDNSKKAPANKAEKAGTAMLTKEKRYLDLVKKRKKCTACSEWGLINQSRINGGKFDKDMVIGSWSLWQGSLDAKILVVGQDWGNEASFIKQKGKPVADGGLTNGNLIKLFDSIGIPVEPPGQRQNPDLFFTNAVLCMKQGGITDKIGRRSYNNCYELFLKELISIIEPQVIITLGKNAYISVARIHGEKPEAFSGLIDRIIEEQEPVPLNGGKRWLLPAPHCGPLGIAFKSFDKQKKMWQAAKTVLK